MYQLLLFTLASVLTAFIGDISDVLSWHHASEIALVVLSVILAGTAVAYRGLIESLQKIIEKYNEYSDPLSDEGRRISADERAELFNLAMREVNHTWSDHRGAILDFIGRLFKSIIRKFGFR